MNRPGFIARYIVLTVLFIGIIVTVANFNVIRSLFSKAAVSPDIALTKNSVVVDPELYKKLPKQSNTNTVEALVFLQKVNLTNKVTERTKVKRNTQRTAMVTELQTKSFSIQSKVLSPLKALQTAKKLTVKKSFYVDNVLLVQLDRDALDTLASSPGVLKITPDYQIKLEPMVTTTSTATPEWNISQIGADQVWNQYGINGTGVVVANIDTGVQWDHPALINQYRGWNGTSANNDYNWYDPTGTSPSTPADNDGHGTHTMGIMVGGDATDAIGVAPGAKWIAAKGCATSGCSMSDLLSAGQWMLAPTKIDGTNPDPTKAPDVINNSWGGGSCSTWFSGMIDSWTNAGIISVFSAGNTGPNPSTINSPGDNPQAFSVGAVDWYDAIASFSSRGPTCYDFGTIHKPDVTAPGMYIRSSIPTNSFEQLSGTSMAAPHVAGVIALLLQANPSLTFSQISSILKSTTTDLGPTGIDDSYGWGFVNALKAVQAVPSPTVFPTPTQQYPSHVIHVTSPAGGEQLQPGQQYRIQWTEQNVNNVWIDLDDGNGATTTIALSQPASAGQFVWTVPINWYGTSNAFRIKVYEATDQVFDFSNTFNILYPQPTPTSTPTPTPTPMPTPTLTPTPTPASIKILSPNGGEIIPAYTQFPIRWTADPSITTVSLELVNINTSTSSIASRIPASSGIYNAFAVTPNGFGQYKIRIYGFPVWPMPTDISDDYFSIVNPATLTPTPTPVPTDTPTPTPTPTLSPTPTPTNTPTPTSTPTPTPTPVVCDIADIDNNGIVDQHDYNLLLSDFLLTNPTNPKSDINGDGIVDLTDYSILVSHYLNQTGPCH